MDGEEQDGACRFLEESGLSDNGCGVAGGDAGKGEVWVHV